jgi:hypothetical protein
MHTTTTFSTTILRGLAILALLAPLAGCFSPAYSYDTPFWCTEAEPQCPDGYKCAVDDGSPDPSNPDHRLCKKPGGGVTPGGCLDDDLEKPPNDAAQTATNLDGSLAGHPQGVSLYGVEICTPEDIDYYSFTVTSDKKATVLVQYTRDQGELSAELLDPSLAVLAQGSPIGGGLQLEATMQSQSAYYYLVIKAGPGGTKNKYDFSITFTTP